MSWNNEMRPVPVQSRGGAYVPSGLAAAEGNKVLRNTYLLLSMTLLFSAAMRATPC